MSLNFVFIGAGNLATQLSFSLKKNGYNIAQVYSRTENSAKTLAEKLDARFTTSLNEIITNADIYFIAISDSALIKVLPFISFQNKLIVHCSGSLPLSVLNDYSHNTGVFYPLQTFSKEREIDFCNVPVFLEANSDENQNKLLSVAEKISKSVNILDSEKRKYLHISAVFACNFVNHLYTISSEILKSNELSFDFLKPLILETANKIQTIQPANAQTGPAIRFDKNIISNHLNELKGKKNYDDLYSILSQSIFQYYQKLE